MRYYRRPKHKADNTLSPISTGKTGGGVVHWHRTVSAANQWIDQQRLKDPVGVRLGQYYVDVPESYQRMLTGV
jgi:hypothetical protein